jgi:hypothetical protein
MLTLGAFHITLHTHTHNMETELREIYLLHQLQFHSFPLPSLWFLPPSLPLPGFCAARSSYWFLVRRLRKLHHAALWIPHPNLLLHYPHTDCVLSVRVDSCNKGACVSASFTMFFCFVSATNDCGCFEFCFYSGRTPKKIIVVKQSIKNWRVIGQGPALACISGSVICWTQTLLVNWGFLLQAVRCDSAD